jgi:hypothetical protein
VLLVMPEQWPRALLRAALRESGYDAVGARTLAEALRARPAEPHRGPVRLVVVDQPALDVAAGGEQLARLLNHHGGPATLLLARTTMAAPGGSWHRVLRRPVSVADVVAATQALMPLPAEGRHPID